MPLEPVSAGHCYSRALVRRASHLSPGGLAAVGSAAGVLFVALVAATPGSPFQPVLPAGAQPSGPFRRLAGVVGLDRVHGEALAAVGVVAVVVAAVTFALVFREAWRGNLSLRLVIGLAVAYHVVVLFLPLLFSRDVYSYAYSGRIASVYHANPYVATPADFPRDPLASLVGPKWRSTPSVYGPLFTELSALLTRAVGSVAGMIVAFRLIAAAASLATIALVARLARVVRPERAAFAVAAIGLNPAVLFQSVGSGHNDLLVGLAVVGALALLFARRELPATAVLTLGALVKATAGVPLLILIAASVARREPGRRGRALASHLAVAGGIGLLFAAPFLQTKDPTLGMVELASHEGWLAPSRFFRRVLGGLAHLVGGDMAESVVGVVVRIAFPLALAVALFLVLRGLVRRAPDISPSAEGAAWGWGLLFLMLLGPILLPWYVTWALPLAWLLPRAPRRSLLGASLALTVSQFATEPARFTRAFDANLFFGHYVVTPVVVALLVWLVLDLRRRVRSGAPLEEKRHEVAAGRGEG